MKLNDVLELDKLSIRRVPGGWIYERMEPQVNVLETTFVPFNNEFQVDPPKSELVEPPNSTGSSPEQQTKVRIYELISDLRDNAVSCPVCQHIVSGLEEEAQKL